MGQTTHSFYLAAEPSRPPWLRYSALPFRAALAAATPSLSASMANSKAPPQLRSLHKHIEVASGMAPTQATGITVSASPSQRNGMAPKWPTETPCRQEALAVEDRHRARDG
jgi:hypothetical protein